MSLLLRTLINSLETGSQEIESEIELYFDDLNQHDLVDPANWSEAILIFGAHILASGSPERQRHLLEQGWNPTFTALIKKYDIQDQWFNLEMELIRKLDYTPGVLFQRRTEQLGKKSLFKFKQGREWQTRSWSAISNTVDHLAAGLIDLMGNNNPRIAILSENRLEVACTDIACLSYGFVNVPIQPAAPPAQIEYILQHAEIEGIFVSDSQHLRTIENILPGLPRVKHIITYNNVVSTNPLVKPFKRLVEDGGTGDSLNWLAGIRLSVSLDRVASIMYTSGTTGHPKGIVFTYENIISKRFARSLALNLGPADRSLSFLPLFHTFGRFLEIWGSIFWWAEYTFSSGKGIKSRRSDLRDINPTVLISVP
ncbi:MAG: AMP-binding protein, partial [Candidatus Marinimicrobia bacterium]|nr:AMP-binding protein [Candidatus Neomarinimicrobiota bacterium]